MQLSEFTFYISKASFDKTTQERRWMAVASDTDLDLSKEKMSLDVFKAFIERAKADIKVPAPFASKFWDGGMPYISVSHYLDLDGKWAAGIVDDLYIDGEKLKAKGKFFNNPIGIKVFDSVCKSLYSETGDGYEQKIRISIGFIDYAHKHGDVLFERKNLSEVCPYCAEGTKNKVYVDGQLVHLAVTRIPCNQRTEFGLDLEEKSMTTRKQDAATIVGDELAEEMEKEHSLIGKAEESLVIKKKKEDSEEESEDEEDKKVKKSQATVAKFANGAMSFSEYEEKQEAQEQAWKLYDVMYTFGGIAENILSYSENPKEAMKTLVSELSTKLEEKTFKFQEKLDERLELVINKLDNNVELVQKAEPHPLDESLMNLKSLYDSAIESYETVDERLQAIQGGIDAVGEAILENVKSKSEATTEVQTSSSDESIERIIEKAIAPLAEKLAKITEQWNTVAESQNTVNKGVYIPKPRGMNSNDLATKSEVEVSSPTPKLAAMIRGTNKSQAPRTRL
jgi:hypothetical protein